MYKKYIISLCCLFSVIAVCSSVCIAGSANLTILHDDPSLKAVKYIIKYGSVEQENPVNYPNTIEIGPNGGPVAGQSTTRVDLGNGNSGNVFFSVKIVYENGAETDFSESSFPIIIPRKTTNLRVN